MESQQEIREKVKEGSVTIGTELTLKALKFGQLEKVIVTKNCSAKVRGDIESNKGDTEVISVEFNNEELGTICRKQFAISVVGFKKR